MDQSYYPHIWSRQNQQLQLQISEAINGEYSAIQCYERISAMAPSQSVRNQILEIRTDEISHFQHFRRIYTSLFGAQPSVKITEECPNNYREALDFAFRDEQQTVDKYLDITELTNDSSIKEAFRRAAADEQNHAVWFLYFMSQNQ
ncbi:rubrerythrin [Peribacillus deserti]|uniref:Rubrerythrin n=1 Tax=Peribacillus deserti TaxID=673318 RepID=A0ABS2QJV7_9BACI|nr:ferritin-like domain-containing protein [Peribacillus deserti]MBM7692783.1 rubrerythrin [Peribacillus deserti]